MNSYLNIKLSQFLIWISREKSEPIREKDLRRIITMGTVPMIITRCKYRYDQLFS